MQTDDVSTNKAWIKQLIAEQKKIGWDKIWKGFVTQTWGDIQEQHYRHKEAPHSRTGATWMKNVIIHLWKHILDLWTKRNDTIHHKNKTTPAQLQILQGKISKLYTQHCTHQGHYKFLFKKSIQEIQQHNKAYLERWIELAEMIQTSNQLNKKRRKPIGQSIKKYLPQKSKPPEKQKKQ